MMRGPQTPAELRTRASRMVPIDSPERLAELLCRWRQRGLVSAFRRAAAFAPSVSAQRLCPGLHPLDAAAPAATEGAATARHAPTRAALSARLDALEATIERLEQPAARPGREARRTSRRVTGAAAVSDQLSACRSPPGAEARR